MSGQAYGSQFTEKAAQPAAAGSDIVLVIETEKMPCTARYWGNKNVILTTATHPTPALVAPMFQVVVLMALMVLFLLRNMSKFRDNGLSVSRSKSGGRKEKESTEEEEEEEEEEMEEEEEVEKEEEKTEINKKRK